MSNHERYRNRDRRVLYDLTVRNREIGCINVKLVEITNVPMENKTNSCVDPIDSIQLRHSKHIIEL